VYGTRYGNPNNHNRVVKKVTLKVLQSIDAAFKVVASTCIFFVAKLQCSPRTRVKPHIRLSNDHIVAGRKKCDDKQDLEVSQ